MGNDAKNKKKERGKNASGSSIGKGARVARLLLFLAFSILSACSEKPAENARKNAPPPPDNGKQGVIVALGDSLTEGYGLEEDKAYPALLSKKLKENGYDYRVVNAGVSGETSAGTLSRISWIMSLDPDLVILETGANDGLRGLDPDLTRKNIREIIRRFKEKKVTVVLAGMKMFHSLGQDYSEKFNAVYPELAESEDVALIPFFLEGVAGERELNLSDGIHPNEEGYRIVVEHIYPFIVENL